ncbi:ATP-binding protein [Mycobacterium deserti]|uniref:ATP-binding protein n=1 Tax=Mycobacterium deserti TaxID=2978347 RepID=A0ABT2M909_9MYCO|nr:ATP-binding protein [Mycobacterium deserti]MCT7658748.1 ATP-binding protein [Mycobacterium deserti]
MGSGKPILVTEVGCAESGGTEGNDIAVLETTTGPDTFAAMQRTLDEVWSAHSAPDRARMYMDLAVGEVGANDGKPSSVDLDTVSLPDELAEHGRELAIALRVLDELSYRSDKDGNHRTLVSRTD